MKCRQILIYDQLEEIFDIFPKIGKNKEKISLTRVASALKIIKPLQIVFIIREDYLAQLDPYSDILPEKLRPRLGSKDYEQDAALLAIKGPLKKFQ